MPNVLSPRDLVFRPDNMDETVPHKYGVSYTLPKLRPFCKSTKIKNLYDIEDEEYYFLIPLWMQKYNKNEKDID